MGVVFALVQDYAYPCGLTQTVKTQCAVFPKLGMCLTQIITTAVAQVGRAPWPARDAHVPLLEAKRKPNAPATRDAARPHPLESSTYPVSRNQWTGKTTLRRSRNRDAYCGAKPIGFKAVVRNSDRHQVGTAGVPMKRRIYLKSRQQPGYTHCCRRFSMQARRCVCRVMS